MTRDEMYVLLADYFYKEPFEFPESQFEHRVDPLSSKMMYSLLRKYQPTTCLEIGSWLGGSTITILRALIKNNKPFKFYSSELDEERRLATSNHCVEYVGQSPQMLSDITMSKDELPPQLDFLFLDSDHDAPTTNWIVENVFPRLNPSSLVAIHDWAIEDKDGVLTGKEHGWDETFLLAQKMVSGELPLKKLFWTFKNPGSEEMGFFEYQPKL